METSIEHVLTSSYTKSAVRPSLWKKFILWADGQEEHRLGWTAFAIAGHGCVFTIITTMIILLTGNHFIFWPFAIGAMAFCLIANLAALPTRITIPTLFISLLVDLAIIILCLSNGIDTAGMYP
ncbi:MAG: hypothetical protein ABIR30_12995 [Chitinophagaceae bacterium]